MIKSLIAASLALGTLASPAMAETFTEHDLLNYLQEIGGRVYFDSPLCQEHAGAYGLQINNQVHICTEPHQGNTAELNDTIRHEVWHVVQMCNKGPTGNDPIKTIVIANKRGWTGRGYRPEKWHMEAEAHAAADMLTPGQIKQALDRYCS